MKYFYLRFQWYPTTMMQAIDCNNKLPAQQRSLQTQRRRCHSCTWTRCATVVDCSTCCWHCAMMKLTLTSSVNCIRQDRGTSLSVCVVLSTIRFISNDAEWTRLSGFFKDCEWETYSRLYGLLRVHNIMSRGEYGRIDQRLQWASIYHLQCAWNLLYTDYTQYAVMPKYVSTIQCTLSLYLYRKTF